jgi:maleylpyruvate isomerase
MDDAFARRPSRLPGWTNGHLVTHLARNADTVVRRLDAALAGHVVDMYEGGPPARAAAIEAGAGRPASDLLVDLISADDAVEAMFDSVPESVWEVAVRFRGTDEAPAAELVWNRTREVEIHLVDLDVGYAPADWPQSLVDRWLPELLADLPVRADRRDVMAWLLGRGNPPSLGPWG